MASPDLYRQLQRHLDKMPVGFPATPSGVELRILRRLFSPEDAWLALRLSAIAEPLGTIHRRARSRYTREALAEALASMAARGLILRAGRARPRYGKLPFVVGIYERQLTHLDAALERDILEYFESGFAAALHTTKTTQMRTVPVNVSLAPDRDVTTYDDIRGYVRSSEGPFAVMPCICRLGKSLVGHACSQTSRQETCLTFGTAASGLVEAGEARTVTRDEMLDLLDEADRDGLVLQPGNTQAPIFVCCCCGCCCGVLTTAKRMPEPAAYFSTNYSAEADATKCSGCGTCLTRCPMDAISLDTGVAVVARSHRRARTRRSRCATRRRRASRRRRCPRSTRRSTRSATAGWGWSPQRRGARSASRCRRAGGDARRAAPGRRPPSRHAPVTNRLTGHEQKAKLSPHPDHRRDCPCRSSSRRSPNSTRSASSSTAPRATSRRRTRRSRRPRA
ncbi:MAG: 4Fe-4S binding protein [Vicinamibacterales bacterium]|nr:4Fe-4S binding protein [Vicinamibacterales bacterium]